MNELLELLKGANITADIHIELQDIRCTSMTEDSKLANRKLLNPVVEAVRRTKVGETVEIENADGSTTEWIVLSKTEIRAELITADCVAERQYNHSTPYPTWADSDIREWLNSEYYNSLGEEMQQVIAEQEIRTATYCAWKRTETTKDKIYLLTETGNRSNTVATPSGVVFTPEQLRCADEIAAYYWWLRSPRGHSIDAGVSPCSDGTITNDYVTETYGVRPSVTINI